MESLVRGCLWVDLGNGLYGFYEVVEDSVGKYLRNIVSRTPLPPIYCFKDFYKKQCIQ